MWEGGKLGCSQNYNFLAARNNIFLIYHFPAKCLNVFYLKGMHHHQQHHHFLVEDRETELLGESMTCLNSRSNPLEELRLQ